MRWSVTYDHSRLHTYHIPTNRYALPGVVKEGYLPYFMHGSIPDQVLKNYCLFSVTYQPYVKEVFEFENYLVFVLDDVPNDRMHFIVDGLFPEFESVLDNVLPFMYFITDSFSLPSTIEHTTIDGEEATIIRRFYGPKACEDDTVYDRLEEKYTKTNLVIIDYDLRMEEQYVGHINDIVLHMLDKKVTNNYRVFDINKFVDDLVDELDRGDFTRFFTIRESILLTMELGSVPKQQQKKKKKRKVARW